MSCVYVTLWLTTTTDCLPSAEAQSFEDEWQQKVSVKPQSFGPGRHLEEPRSRVAPMAAITGPEQTNRFARFRRTHTDWQLDQDLCSYSSVLFSAPLNWTQVCFLFLHFSTETNHRAKLLQKATWSSPKQQNSEGGAVPVSHSLNQAALNSSVASCFFFSKAGCTMWLNGSPLKDGRFHISGIYSASSWGNNSLWTWK